MALATPSLQERRKFPRSESPLRLFGVSLLQPQGPVPASPVNVSEGGFCFRLEEVLEVRSLVRLQVTPARPAPDQSRGGARPDLTQGQVRGGIGFARVQRPVECKGRVAWVIQRLDLRSTPPFLYDVGVEFVDPHPILRQFLTQRIGQLSALKGRAARGKQIEPVMIRGRQFIPRLEREPTPPMRWHLVVSVDGTPCFSGHYPFERAAVAAWARFKRQQARR